MLIEASLPMGWSWISNGGGVRRLSTVCVFSLTVEYKKNEHVTL